MEERRYESRTNNGPTYNTHRILDTNLYKYVWIIEKITVSGLRHGLSTALYNKVCMYFLLISPTKHTVEKGCFFFQTTKTVASFGEREVLK